VEGCTPTTTCLTANQECGTLNNGCTVISCGTCLNGLQCSSSGQCQPPIISSVVQTQASNRSIIYGAVAAGAFFFIFLLVAIIVGILYVRKRRENTMYSLLELDPVQDSSPNFSSPNPVISGPSISSPATSNVPQPPPPPPTSSNPRTLRKPPPPAKKLPPPTRPLPEPLRNQDVQLPPAPSNVPVPPPVNHNDPRSRRTTVRIPRSVVIPPPRAPAQRSLSPSRVNPSQNAPPQTTRNSVKRAFPKIGGRKMGDTVQAKYSLDGKFYPAVIDDIQHGYYLVHYPSFPSYQEWVPLADVK